MTFGLLIFGLLSIFFPALRTGWLHLGVPRQMLGFGLGELANCGRFLGKKGRTCAGM
jgi:hypothetical protein